MMRFGPAGNSDSFSQQGKRGNLDVPDYLCEFGLNAYEYQCGHGVRLNEKAGREFGKRAQEKDIALSLHSPYYISLSSPDADKRAGSVNYILQSARAVDILGGNRIVVHSGSVGKRDREEALALAKATLKEAQAVLDQEGYSRVVICPEVMGKVGQLGALEEVIDLCKVDERMLPCVDFGHLNARTNGSLVKREDFERVLNSIEKHLGNKRMRKLHIHFSKIEYTEAGGEKRHLTFEDKTYGPAFEPLAEVLADKGCEGVLICESAGTQAEDARTMMNIYEGVKERAI